MHHFIRGYLIPLPPYVICMYLTKKKMNCIGATIEQKKNDLFQKAVCLLSPIDILTIHDDFSSFLLNFLISQTKQNMVDSMSNNIENICQTSKIFQ